MGGFLDIFHRFIFSGLVFLFFFESILLFIRGKNNKPRRALGIALFVWAVSYLIVLIKMYICPLPEYNSILRANIAVLGNYYIVLVYYFPLQAIKPGWFTRRRAIKFFMPIVVITMSYYVGMYVLDETYEDIYTYKQLWNSFGHFNVWYRLVILFTNIYYMVFVSRWLYQQEQNYIKWKNENFSDQDSVDISWIKVYYIIMIILFASFICGLVIGGRELVIVHALVHIVSFSYLFYIAMCFENPQLEDFYGRNQMDQVMQQSLSMKVDVDKDKPEDVIQVDASFEQRIPSYAAAIRKWMDEERPYLFKEFKLTDVSRLLPLNRSYLSRVFNEGFGKNFSEVVRDYRVEYAKELLKRNPSLTIYQVAELSGFSSDTTFSRTFKQMVGMTPNQFKMLR